MTNVTEPRPARDMSPPQAPNAAAQHKPPPIAILAEVGGSLAAAASVDAVLDDVIGRVRAATGMDAAECFLREPQSGQMVLAAVQGESDDAFREITHFRTGEGYPGLVAARGESLLTFDLPSDQRYLRGAVKAAGYKTYLCVPLLGPAGVLGSVHIAARRQDERVREYVSLLTAVAGTLALAVARDQAQIASRFAAGLVSPRATGGEPRTGGGMHDGDARHYTAAHVLLHAVRAAGADGGAIFWRDRWSRSLDVLAAAGPYRALRDHGADRSPEVACPLAVASALRPPVYSWETVSSSRESCPRDSLCAPIRSRLGAGVCLGLVQDRHLAGVLSVGWRRAPGVPTRALAWLSGLVPMATLALRAAAEAPPPSTVTEGAGGGRAPDLTAVHGSAVMAQVGEKSSPLAIHGLGACALARYGVPAGEEVWGRPRFRRLFALLLTKRGQWLPREVLADALWPDLPLPAARHNLRVALAAVRRALQPDLLPAAPSRFVQRRADLVGLTLPHDVWLDVAAFEALSQPALSACGTGDLDEPRLQQLSAAAALYGGDYLPGDLYEPWALDERQRLLHRYVTVVERLAAAWSARGRDDLAAQYHRLLLERDPANEAAHRGLMADLAAGGHRAAALRQYEVCREFLRRELDVAPLPETTALYRRIAAG